MLRIAVVALGLVLSASPGEKALLDLAGQVVDVLVDRDAAGVAWTDVDLDAGDGRRVRLRLAPPEVLERLDFRVAPGDRVKVRAFESGDPHDVHRITNESTGRFLRLRCLHGDPIWDTPRGRHGRRYGRGSRP